MHRTDAIAWVVSVCSVSLRLSQAKTLGILVAAAMRVRRLSLANIGRMTGGAVKHQIKRRWRFCANDRVETADARLCKLYGRRMTIEQLFRDDKSKRNGWGLRATPRSPSPIGSTACC